MKHHQYYNTIWSDRDAEFWWDGVKDGLIIATILTSILWIDGMMFINYIKEQKKKSKKEES